jgi:hypothetical protein
MTVGGKRYPFFAHIHPAPSAAIGNRRPRRNALFFARVRGDISACIRRGGAGAHQRQPSVQGQYHLPAEPGGYQRRQGQGGNLRGGPQGAQPVSDRYPEQQPPLYGGAAPEKGSDCPQSRYRDYLAADYR